MSYIGSFGVYSFGRYFTFYLLGFYIFTNKKNIDKIMKNKKLILGLFCLFQIILVIAYYNFSYYGDLLVNLVGWLGSLSCIIIGELYLNKESKLTNYFKKSSFPIYILHLPVLVVIGYYSLIMINNIILQICIIIFGSFIVTILIYEIIRKILILNKVIGVK